MKRRSVLAGLGVLAVSALAGCSGNTTREAVEPADDASGETADVDGINGSTFYKGARIEPGGEGEADELVIDTHEKLNIRENGDGYMKAESLVLFNDGEWVAERTPVYDVLTYRFPIPGDGSYTLVATGSASDGGDFPTVFEMETILEVAVDYGKVRVEEVYFTKQREEL